MADQAVRKADGMIRCKVVGGGPLKASDTVNSYPKRDNTGKLTHDERYDEYIPFYQLGWYRRKGEYPNYSYHWEPKT